MALRNRMPFIRGTGRSPIPLLRAGFLLTGLSMPGWIAVLARPVSAAPTPHAVTLAGTEAPQDITLHPKLELDKDRFDFGELLSGEVRTRKLTFRNTGLGDLRISQFEFSCGCTIPRIVLSTGETYSLKDFRYEGHNELVLKPGVTAESELEFSSLGRKSNVTYKMVIHSNDPKHPHRLIPILAKVKPAFNLRPKSLKFGELEKGQTVTRWKW